MLEKFKERNGLIDGGFEHFGRVPARVGTRGPDPRLEHMRSEPLAFARRAPDEQVAQELHLNLLITRTSAALALAAARIETEGTQIELLANRVIRKREQSANVVPGTHIA